MKILAIDPGLSGGFALLHLGRLIVAGDLPRVGDGSQSRINAAEFASIVRMLKPDTAVIEEVSAMPRQGVSSTFRFGRAVGAIEGVLAAIGAIQSFPLHRVSPQRWKAHFKLVGKGDGGAELARQRAIERWPRCIEFFSRKKDHNRAEAALIALWFAETQPQSMGRLVATNDPSEGALERSTARG